MSQIQPEHRARSLTDWDVQRRRVQQGLGPSWDAALAACVEPLLQTVRHGDFAGWLAAIADLAPGPGKSRLDLTAPEWRPTIELNQVGADEVALRKRLLALGPWRKGPYQIGPVLIDAEWNSASKWQRFAPQLDFRERRVLDVGAANGYFSLRAVGAGAAFALGVEPAWRSIAQWRALQQFFSCEQAALLPLRLGELPQATPLFDIALSLGVLYHQRDPLEHLQQLRAKLRAGGTLVLETLIVEQGESIVPKQRYAAMRNVWQVPSLSTVERWLAQSGFSEVQSLDVTRTTSAEQRSTAFMSGPSLLDFLDPACAERTVEGYPAPVRAIYLAR